MSAPRLCHPMRLGELPASHGLHLDSPAARRLEAALLKLATGRATVSLKSAGGD